MKLLPVLIRPVPAFVVLFSIAHQAVCRQVAAPASF